MESALAAALSVATLLAVLLGSARVGGMVFVAGFAAYTAGRQLLFPLRGQSRKTSHGRQITLWIAAATFLTATAVAVLA